MKGLIYKEFCMMKAQMKGWIIAFLIMAVYGIMFNNPSLMYTITSIVGVMNAFSTFTYDKMYRCEEYIGALPVSRKRIVLSKYVFLFCLDMIFVVLTSILALIQAPLYSESLTDLLSYAAGTAVATIILQALIVPVAYLYGPEKARIACMVVAFAPCLLLMAAGSRLAAPSRVMMNLLLLSVPFVAAAIIALSIAASIAVYRKKDL